MHPTPQNAKRETQNEPLNGFYLVHKPVGPSSAGIVGRLKWLILQSGYPRKGPGALRIGHGVGIAHDIDFEGDDDETTFVSLGTISQWVKDREIALELAPSSNLQTGAIAHWGDDLADHPFDLLYQLGFRVTVNTDNRLMSGTSITRELSLLRDAFGYDLSDFEVFQLNAAAATFLSVEDREDLSDRISDGFDAAGR